MIFFNLNRMVDKVLSGEEVFKTLCLLENRNFHRTARTKIAVYVTVTIIALMKCEMQ